MATPRTYLRDTAAEQSALRDSLKSTAEGGANVGISTDTKDVATLDPSTRRLLEEQVNSRVYGAARPTFAEPGTGSATGTASGTTATADTVAPATTSANTTQNQQLETDNDLMSRIESAFPEVSTMTQDELAAAEMARIQDQIDAINQLYDVRLADEQRKGEGRLGSTRSLNALSGSLYDPFGQARTTETEAYNREAEGAIQAERANLLASLTNEAAGRAQSQFQEQTAQALKRADSYVSAITNAYQLNQQEEEALRKEALQRAQLTGQLDGQDTLGYRQFLLDSVNALEDNARADQQLELQRQQYERAGYQTQVMPDGNLIAYDMNKFPPEPIVIGNYARPTTAGGSGGTTDDPALDYLNSVAALRYQQATGSSPTNSNIDYVTNAFNAAYQQAYNQNNPGSYGPVYNVDPASITNPFQYPGRNGGGEDEDLLGSY